jgi:citrate synthase
LIISSRLIGFKILSRFDPTRPGFEETRMDVITRGLEGIAITETRLSRVDGEAGELVIAGFALEEIAPRASFEEMLFLLWNARLPEPGELEALCESLAARRILAPATLAVLRAAAAVGAAPMDALRMGIATLGLVEDDLHHTELQAEPPHANRRRALRLVAAMPTVAAAYHRLVQGLAPVASDPALGHAASYLHMLGGEAPSAERVRALETYLNTTVDHGMNASTFTARVIASTRSCMASAVVGALGALKGPLHGGAPGPALDMVFALQRRAAESGRSLAEVADDWAREAVERGERIMGFGHRVYKVRDPRADVLGRAIARLEPEPAPDGIQAAARSVEEVVLRVLAEKKPGRRLQTNVEFYTALILHSLGLESSCFTPTFAVARVAGWTAHILEQIEEDRLIRPQVVYTGPCNLGWVPAELRGAVAGVA